MQFIPFEDDWDALARLRAEDLVPYQVGMIALADRRAANVRQAVEFALTLPSTPSSTNG
jgi:hypothetical protein